MLDVERIVHIIACMYGQKAEAVINISRNECYLYLGISRNQLSISGEEIVCLEENGIVEFFGGNNEPGYETQVYVLTEEAQKIIKAILNNRKILQLKE